MTGQITPVILDEDGYRHPIFPATALNIQDTAALGAALYDAASRAAEETQRTNANVH